MDKILTCNQVIQPIYTGFINVLPFTSSNDKIIYKIDDDNGTS
jgi:hypothetical protein